MTVMLMLMAVVDGVVVMLMVVVNSGGDVDGGSDGCGLYDGDVVVHGCSRSWW